MKAERCIPHFIESPPKSKIYDQLSNKINTITHTVNLTDNLKPCFHWMVAIPLPHISKKCLVWTLRYLDNTFLQVLIEDTEDAGVYKVLNIKTCAFKSRGCKEAQRRT